MTETTKLGAVAKIIYLDGDFEVDTPGTHVICAVTGKPILLNMLRYWNVARQEAYIDAAASCEASKASEGE